MMDEGENRKLFITMGKITIIKGTANVCEYLQIINFLQTTTIFTLVI